ncbi:uncharacterized protein LOC124177565 isoform X2 [Neodiprion fabricii]|uniref:uncharacterized protein LOC124177565 isoform X2 n=1 Tax=Neodiprion fabricii TaxID=2872261 RepID=UPI001ED92A34|nr:uncharacterized protein LOC124177565 isoform X2 [Neodiprion fabricii]
MRSDHENGHMLAKFAPPPYGNKTANKLLESLIKSQSPALPNWPEYVVELVGHADTYEKSIERLGILQNDEFAYTTDSDNTGQEKASQITEKIKKESLEKIMEVPRLESDDSVENDTRQDDDACNGTRAPM